jgi:hypothetical protein
MTSLLHRASIPAGAVAACLAAATLLAACSGDDGATSGAGESIAAGPTTSTTAETTTAATTTAPTTTATPPPPPGPPFGLGPESGSAQGGSGLALLTAVRVGGHEGFDRVVFQFLPGPTPGYRVRYVQPPIIEDPSGRTVRVAGTAFLSIRMEPASGFDLTGPRGQVYTGPSRIDGSSAGGDVVEEVVLTGDFEAVMNWVIGLDGRAPFRVLRLSGPPRLVVDFAHS